MFKLPNNNPKSAKPSMASMMLPDVVKTILQPNRITEAQYDYNLIQQKILMSVIVLLQQGIHDRIKGHTYEQLDIFRIIDEDNRIVLKILLRDIVTTKYNYSEAREAAKSMATIMVTMPGKDPFTGKVGIDFKGLMQVFIPENYQHDKHIVVKLDKDVAKRLMEIETRNGIPINYTRLDSGVVLNNKNKYAVRIYQLLCKYRQAGYNEISVEDFKTWLGLQDKYQVYKDLKKRVIIPACEHLFEKADCWFDYNDPRFEIKKNRVVTKLRFVVIVPEKKQLEGIKKDNIINMLRAHFHFTDNNLEQIREPVLGNTYKYDLILEKLLFLQDKIRSSRNTSEKIVHIPQYVITSLLTLVDS